MYRSLAAKRLVQYSFRAAAAAAASSPIGIARSSSAGVGFRFLSSSDNDFSSSSSSSSTHQQQQGGGGGGDGHHHHHNNNNNNNNETSSSSRRRNRWGANYEEEQARVLAASLQHVIRLGWSEAAMIAGARDVAVSPSIVGAIPRKEAALVEYFMDECLQTLIDIIDDHHHSGGDSQLQDLVASERLAKLIKLRLQMQAPYISKWPQALSIQAQPSNIPTSFRQRAMLVDEFLHASNDEGSGVDWYLKRSIVGGIYSTTEIYMLTDNSTDFDDTWIFLNGRVRDAFDLKKTFQEVQYFAEAVGAGLGISLQGFTKKGY